ncbi:MAG TPA: hypothetical protein VN957_20730 [Chthoniobacterales bacterium]|nr:hypothetical protein [Chthoniobacterales bacterium]
MGSIIMLRVAISIIWPHKSPLTAHTGGSFFYSMSFGPISVISGKTVLQRRDRLPEITTPGYRVNLDKRVRDDHPLRRINA